MGPEEVLKKYIHKGDEVCFGRGVNKLLPPFEPVFNKLLFNKTTDKEIGLLAKRLGGIRDTLDGEAWDVCIPVTLDTTGKFAICPKKAPYMALKIVPMSLKDYQNPFNIKRRPWRELVILQKTTKEYNKTHIIAFPILYDFALCSSVNIDNYINKRIRDRITKADPEDKFGKQALFLFSQLADYDMEFWMKKMFINFPDKENLMMSVLFQIYFGIHALHVLTDTIHFDLHLGNILISSTEPGGYFHYNLDNTDYYVPNNGLIFKIWDFSRSVVLDEDEPHIIKQKFVFFGKRNFPRKFDSILPKIAENLLKKSHVAVLYSMDVYRFTKSLFSVLRVLQQTTTTRQKSAELREIEDLLEDILLDASDDIIKIFPKKTTPHYQGTANKIIKTYFKEFKEPPKNAKILPIQKIETHLKK